jgi:hypothetical protein
MSKLFVYGVAIKKYDFGDMKSDIKNICSKSFLLNREKNYGEDETTLILFDKYIFMDNYNE